MNLRAAHKGYRYQDIFVAIHLASALVCEPSRIFVDKKLFSIDHFDDLTVENENGSARFQVKHSLDANRVLASGDLHESGQLALGALVHSFVSAGSNSRNTLCASVTWNAPTDPNLLRALRPIDPLPGLS